MFQLERFILLIGLLVGGVGTINSADAETRVALVIGNGAYRNAPQLANPLNDATAVAAALRRGGFETILATNLDKSRMDETAIQFAKAARVADVAVFYYSGHAIQFAGVNYLAPIDAKLTDEADLRRMVRLDDIVRDVQQARNLRILVLDSCRDNPLADELKRSVGTTRALPLQQGLAKIDTPLGMIVAYATQAGRTADDGDGRNSPYTAAFLKYIEQSEEIGTVFRRISSEVYESTQHRQLPELSLSITGEFYLRGKLEVTMAPGQSVPDFQVHRDPPSQVHLDPPGALKYAVVEDVPVRDAPTDSASSPFTLHPGQEVAALGKVEQKLTTEQILQSRSSSEDLSTWVKVRNALNREGFVQLKNLWTDIQLTQRREWSDQKERLQEFFKRANRAKGAFSKSAAGVYCPGKFCVDRPDYRFSELMWSEGNTLYLISIDNPREIHSASLSREGTVKINGIRFNTYRVVGLPGISSEKIAFDGQAIYYLANDRWFPHSSKPRTLASDEQWLFSDYFPDKINIFARYVPK
jgi:hypothetical protein